MATQGIITSAQYEAIDHLTRRIHPDAVAMIKTNLIQTFTRQVAKRRNDLHDLEELNDFVEREANIGSMWATW